MSKKALQHDKIGYWSEVKLDIVRKYASAYSTIMAKQPSFKRHVYVDAFAGAGQHISKTTGDFVPAREVLRPAYLLNLFRPSGSSPASGA